MQQHQENPRCSPKSPLAVLPIRKASTSAWLSVAQNFQEARRVL